MGCYDGGPFRELTPGARTGLETATRVVNAGSGCSAAVKAVERVVVELVSCWYPREIEGCEDAAVRTATWPRSLPASVRH